MRHTAPTAGLMTVLLLLLGGGACAPEPHPYTEMICDAEGTNCHCPLSSWRLCDERCVNPLTDPQHCGACGNSCGEQVCLSGACADDCGELERCGEQVCLSGACADDCGELERCGDICRLPDDPFNCGACGVRCAEGCANGICQEHVECRPLTSCQGRCVDTRTDIQNCGGCGNDCLGRPYCQNGSCADCPFGLTLCYGSCVDLERDGDNCGRCGNFCINDSFDHQYCKAGWCEECPIEENMRVCHGQCVSLATEENCGDCDVQCTGGDHCHNGWCQSY